MVTDPLDVAITDESFASLPFPPGWAFAPAAGLAAGTWYLVPPVLSSDPASMRPRPFTLRSCETLRHLDTVARVLLPAAGYPYPYAVPRG